MRILFAAPDRDLLMCYSLILSEAFGETITAFDGTQTLALLSEKTFDAVVLDKDIPRVEYGSIVKKLNEKNIPVIVLTNEPITVGLLSGENLANAYLIYPFSPAQMTEALKDTAFKAAEGKSFALGDIEIDVSGFRIKNGPRLTSKEIDIMSSLARGADIGSNNRSSVNALNGKLAAFGSGARIKYKPKEGFRLVTKFENKFSNLHFDVPAQ